MFLGKERTVLDDTNQAFRKPIANEERVEGEHLKRDMPLLTAM